MINNQFSINFYFKLSSPKIESVFQSIPNDKFFLETDAIEETLDEVYKLAAKYKNINLPDLKEIINSNFNFVFNKSNNLISLTNQTI